MKESNRKPFVNAFLVLPIEYLAKKQIPLPVATQNKKENLMLFIYFIEIWMLIGTLIFFSLGFILRVLRFVFLPKFPSLKNSSFFQKLLSVSKYTLSAILSVVLSTIVFAVCYYIFRLW